MRNTFGILQGCNLIRDAKGAEVIWGGTKQSFFKITLEKTRTCWALSKMTVRDLARDQERTEIMVFVEYLEFLCRVAYIADFQVRDIVERQDDFEPLKVSSMGTQMWESNFYPRKIDFLFKP